MDVSTTKKSTLSRKLRWLLLLAVIGIGPLTSSGCLQEMLFLGYLIGGPPSIEPDFDRQTGKSMTDKDVTVAVICYAPKELQIDFDEVDFEIAKYVSHHLNAKKIRVITPERVRDWLDKHPDWDTPEDLGADFNVNYVIYIDVNDYSLYEKSSIDLYRGRAEAVVSVWEMDGDIGEKIYTREINSQYPLAVPRPVREVSYSKFKQQYLTRLSEEIGRLFYEHYNGDDLQDAA